MNQLAPFDAMGAAASGTCAHCGNILAADQAEFCCAGCAAARALIGRMGLSSYYAKRLGAGVARTDKPVADDCLDVTALIASDRAGQCRLELGVGGLQCAACVWLIEQALAQQPDLLAGRVNMTTRRLSLAWPDDGSERALERGNQLVALVQSMGYRLLPLLAEGMTEERKREERALLRAMAVAGFAAANVMLLSVSVWSGASTGMGEATRDLMLWLSALIVLPAIAIAGRPFYASAATALRHGRTNMDVPIAIGVTLAAAMSLHETIIGGPHAYFDSAITLLFFLLVGRYLDRRARGNAFAAAQHLAALQGATIRVIDGEGRHRQIPAQAARAGMMVQVSPGERIAVDGKIVAGRSSIDTSLLTGETIPRAAGPGETVHSGTFNLDGPLTIKVAAAGLSTVLAEIVRMMAAAETARNRFTGLAERVARYYAPVVHGAALLTFLAWLGVGGIAWQPALMIAVSVLIITCPCALALAVPAAQVVAHGRLLRGGLLVKGAGAIERLAEIDTVVFDKTGTLTHGRPRAVDLDRLDEATLRLAAAVARGSAHPLAKSIAVAAPLAPPADSIREFPGQGVEGFVAGKRIRLGRRDFVGVADVETSDATELWIAVDGEQPRCVRFKDQLRADAPQVVAALRARGLTVALLSGDRAGAVAEAARTLGIDDWRGQQTPIDKLARLEELRKLGHKVLMVGDGLNDGPALAAAHVSASPGTAIDIARNAADIVFQGDRLAPVLAMIDMARRTGRIVRQNLAMALLYNLAAVPLAMAGEVTPLIAAVAMSSSSILVIANSLRLARGGEA